MVRLSTSTYGFARSMAIAQNDMLLPFWTWFHLEAIG
jgi:hypothetical protein